MKPNAPLPMLATIRRRQNITVNALARRVGCVPATIHNAEGLRMKRGLSLCIAVAIADALGVSLDELTGRTVAQAAEMEQSA